MIPINIEQVCELFQVPCLTELTGQHVTNITMDSRACIEQSLFVAMKGEQSDGNNFI